MFLFRCLILDYTSQGVHSASENLVNTSTTQYKTILTFDCAYGAMLYHMPSAMCHLVFTFQYCNMFIMIKNSYEFGLIMYEVLSLAPLSIYKPIFERQKLVETRKTSPFNIIRFFGGRGVMKKCTLCALVKMVIIVNDPLVSK